MSSESKSLLYPYGPNQALPIVFAAIVSILAVIHFYQAFSRYKWYHFGTVLAWSSIVWISGLVCRAISVNLTDNVDLFIAQYVLILAGPVLYASSEYFVLGRLLAYLPYHTPIQPGRVLSTFLFLSAAVESLTAAGAALTVNKKQEDSSRTVGLKVVTAGLIIQAVLETSFLFLVALVEWRSRKGGQFIKNVKVTCYVLYTTSIMMLVRCLFRSIQGAQESQCAPQKPYCSTVDRHEWFLWVFEVANITVLIAVMALFHPGRYLPRDSKVYLDPTDRRTERVGPGFVNATDRSFVATLIDPFDVVGILSGAAGARIDKFWLRDNPIASEKTNRQKETDVV